MADNKKTTLSAGCDRTEGSGNKQVRCGVLGLVNMAYFCSGIEHGSNTMTNRYAIICSIVLSVCLPATAINVPSFYHKKHVNHQ